MARKEANLTSFMVTQQTKGEFFANWTDDEKAVLESGDATKIGVIVAAKLYDAGIVIKCGYCITHNRDTVEVWDDRLGEKVQEMKERHFHFVGKTEEGKGGTLTKIAAAIGVEPEYIEKPQRGRYAWDNMLAYLTHIKYAEKAQYEPSEVASIGVPDKDGNMSVRPYEDIYNERKEEWFRGRASVKKKSAAASIDYLEELILTGQVKRNEILLTDEYYAIYARNKRRCDDALDTYAQRKIALTTAAMERGEFKLSVFFITGRSHSGKSYFTDALVKRLQDDAKEKLGQEWEVCSCAASNPFDEYRGEEILVMDDLRGMALTASDWLKLMDADRVNSASSRYHNKRLACRAIIINSEKDVLDFFYYVKGSGNIPEAMDQFYRRIMARVVVFRVPDTDVRRLGIGTMVESHEYHLPEPGTKGGEGHELTLHHKFDTKPYDYDYEEALTHLSNMVMERHHVEVVPVVPASEVKSKKAAEAIRKKMENAPKAQRWGPGEWAHKYDN